MLLSANRNLFRPDVRPGGNNPRGTRRLEAAAAWRIDMAETIHDIPSDWTKRAYVDDAKYKAMYEASIRDPNAFWGEHGKRVDWIKPYTKVKNSSYDPHNVSIKWYEDGVLNVAANCIDRHLAKRGDQVANIWEGDDPKDDQKITYKQLHAEVCR